MAISVSAKGGPSEHATAGVHQAVCSGVYDMGEQDGFGGKKTRKIAILFELDQRYTEGEYAGKRMVVSNIYSAFFSDKSNLRKLVEGWLGKKFPDTIEDFDVETLAGKNCCLNMVISEKGYSNIQSIMPLMANMQPMSVEAVGYIPKWITEKAPHLHSSTDNNGFAQTENKPQKAGLTKETFAQALYVVKQKALEIQPESYKKLWQAVKAKKQEISSELFRELACDFMINAGYDPVANQAQIQFDDQDIPFLR